MLTKSEFYRVDVGHRRTALALVFCEKKRFFFQLKQNEMGMGCMSNQPEVKQWRYINDFILLCCFSASNFNKINTKHIGFSVDLFQFFQNFFTFGTIIFICSKIETLSWTERFSFWRMTYRKRLPAMTIRPTIFPTFCHSLPQSRPPILDYHHRSTIPERTVHFACRPRIWVDYRSGSKPMLGTFWSNNVSPVVDLEF